MYTYVHTHALLAFYFYLLLFLFALRSTVTGSERPTVPWRSLSRWNRGLDPCTAPARQCRCLRWPASRPATTWASWNTGLWSPTGCSLTAWLIEKVKDHHSLVYNQKYTNTAINQESYCSPFFFCALTQEEKTASTSPRWKPAPRWGATSASRRRSWAEWTLHPWGNLPAACSVTPTCVCTTAPSWVCTSDGQNMTYA